MKGISILKIVLGGLFIALVCVTTMFTKIPLPKGYFNLGDVFVMLSAVILGRYYGFIVGGVGSAMADIFLGGAVYAPITLVVKGIEAFAVASIMEGNKETDRNVRTVIAVAAGAFIMVAGYFVAEAYVLRIVDKTFGLAIAVVGLPFNAIQGVLSSICAFILIKVLARTNLIPQNPRGI